MAIVCFYVVPALMVLVGWGAWLRGQLRKSRGSPFSSLSLGFTTASPGLLFGSIVYARRIGGFAYYDPRLMRVFAVALVINLCAIGLGVGGVRRDGPIRIYAPLSAVAITGLWMLLAAME